MRKFVALLVVSAVGLAAPASMGATVKQYNGTFTPGGTLSFKLKKTNKGKKVIDFTFSNFPVACSGGPNTTSGNLTFPVKVKNNKFEAAGVAGNDPNNPRSRLDLTGEFKPGQKAEGTMKVRGPKVNVDNPPPRGTSDCSSPKTNWTATALVRNG